MSKILSMLVAAIMLIVGTTLFSTQANGIEVGKGNGSGDSITNLAEFARLLENLPSDDISNVNIPNKNNLKVKYLSAESTESDLTTQDVDSGKKYSSLTWTADGEARIILNSSKSSEQDSNRSSSESRQSIKIERQLVIYFTESAIYYKVKGFIYYNITSKSSRTGGSEESYSFTTIDIDMDLYMDENMFLFKCKKFNSITRSGADSSSDSEEKEEDRNNVAWPSKYLNRWIRLTKDESYDVNSVISAYSELNRINYKICGCFSDFMDNAKDNKNFTKSDSIYTANKNTVQDLLNSIFLEVFNINTEKFDLDGESYVDLSNNHIPKLFVKYSGKLSNQDKNEYYGYRTKSEVDIKMFEQENYTFKNINNTVIKVPSLIETIDVAELEE